MGVWVIDSVSLKLTRGGLGLGFGFEQDRLWEMVDAEWMECLRREPVESLLMLPSGCVQAWPHTL